MAITIISQPAAIFPAYNPAPLVLKAGNGEEDVTLHFKIDGVAVSTHKREFFSLAEPLTDNFGNPITDNSGNPIPIGGDLLAVFDLGRIARDFFSSALVEINAEQNADAFHVKAYIDRRLCVPFTAEITGVSSPTFTAVNAALAPGIAEADYSAQFGKILSEMPSFKYYEGFTDKSKLFVLLGLDSVSRNLTFVGSRHVASKEITLTGTGLAGGWHVNLQADYGTGEVYYKAIYDEVAGHTGTQAAQAIYDRVSVDETLMGIVVVTHATGTNKVKFTAIEWGLVMDFQFSISMDSGFTIAEESVLSDSTIATTTEGKGSIVAIEYPSLFAGEAVVVNEGTEQTDFKPIEQQCLPSAPFYVRWVNRIGGREHWMFSRKQTDKSDIDDSVTYEPYVTTNEDVGRRPRQISLTEERTVVVGAEGVPSAEFDVLRRITVSPVIEYYDEANLKWRVITIKSGATSKDTSSPVQSIELEFTLPSQALQF